jgi:hypothetical protein
LQLAAPDQGLNEDISDHTLSPLSIVEDLFDDDMGDMSKVPTCDIKDLNVEPAEQDLEEFLVAQENLLEFSSIISKELTEAVKEDNNYIRAYPEPRIICCCLQGFTFQRACYDPKVAVNLLLFHEASCIDMHPLVPSTKIL